RDIDGYSYRPDVGILASSIAAEANGCEQPKHFISLNSLISRMTPFSLAISASNLYFVLVTWMSEFFFFMMYSFYEKVGLAVLMNGFMNALANTALAVS